MNMKKIMATVAAAALAVSAMATSAFAAENPTYKFTKTTYTAVPGAATFTVQGPSLITVADDLKISFKEQFKVPDGWSEAGDTITDIGNSGYATIGGNDYGFDVHASVTYTYYASDDATKAIKTETIPVGFSKDNWNTPTQTFFNLKIVDQDSGVVASDAFNIYIDATNDKVVTKIELKVTTDDWGGVKAADTAKALNGSPKVTFSIGGQVAVATGVAAGAPSANNAALNNLFALTADTTAKINARETDGLAVGTTKVNLCNSTGFKTWLTNNIGYNKGAQLKFTFMTKAELDSIYGDNSYITGGEFVELPFDATNATILKDFAIGVNTEDTTLLQTSAKVLDDNTVIVEWDDIVKSYASTVGDVHSVYVRLNKVNTVLKSVELIIPEQETVDNERTDSAEAPEVTGEEGEDTTADLEEPDITEGEEGEEGEDTDSSIEDGEEGEEGEDTSAEEGDNTGDNGEAGNKGENPSTGVALAIVPAIVAGAAVVISRKRK